MKKIIVASSMLLAAQAFADSAIVDSIKNGKVSGNIRMFNLLNNKKSGQQDTQAFALGGKLHAENAAIMGFNVGLTFMVADDLNLVSKASARRDQKYISNTSYTGNVTALGESYLNYSGFGFNVRTGSQEVVTPFITTSDAQIAPATVSGHAVAYSGVENLKVSAYLLDKFKGRNTATFAPVESTFGITNKETSGVMVGGADYATKEMKATAYYYGFNNIMNLMYVSGGYTMGMGEGLSITPSLQYASEKAAGDKLGLEIGSSVMGANVNMASGDLKVDVAYVTVKEDTSKANNGAFYSRMTYYTDALYTNSMTHGMALSNGDTETNKVGSSYKATVNYALSADLATKLSYAKYDYKTNSMDRSETDWDVTYKFSSIPGLSYTNRLGLVSSDTLSLCQTQWRAQLQMTF
jgi:hypothetical protein